MPKTPHIGLSSWLSNETHGYFSIYLEFELGKIVETEPSCREELSSGQGGNIEFRLFSFSTKRSRNPGVLAHDRQVSLTCWSVAWRLGTSPFTSRV